MTITEPGVTAPPASAAPAGETAATIDLTDGAGPAGTRPTFTITDAATACAVSRKTITRKLADLALHGAAKDEDGIWRIPVEALLAVGLHPGRSLPAGGTAARPSGGPAARPHPAAPPGPEPVVDTVTVPRDRWDDLRIRLARAEAEAAERALALADARLALRALTAGPARAPEPPVAANPASSTAPGAVPAPASDGGPVGSGVIALGPAAGSSGPADRSAGHDAPPAAPPAAPLAVPPAVDPAAQVAAARSHAAQNGGHVPAAASLPSRKRRWWQSK